MQIRAAGFPARNSGTAYCVMHFYNYGWANLRSYISNLCVSQISQITKFCTRVPQIIRGTMIASGFNKKH